MAIQKTEEQHSAFFHLQRQALTQKQACCPDDEASWKRVYKRASAARTRVPKPQHASTAAATATLAFLLAGAATDATTPRLTATTNADVRKNVHTFSCALPTAPPSSPPNTASTAPNDTDATATAMAYIVPSSAFPSSSSSPAAAVQNSMNAHAAAPATTGKTTAGKRSP
uniref:Uncharacterized protein n=1 Tax=Oryza glumipatula TaxID=40148 RepID=A0A0E0AD56_9ORYZ